MQHTLTPSDLIEVIYMGNSGHRIINRFDYDECRPGANLQCVASTRPYPQYSSLLTITSNGNASYEALVARFDHRLSSMLNLRFEYTLAKALEDNSEASDSQISSCRSCEKSPAPYDSRHRAVISNITDVPFGLGRRYGSHISRVEDAALGGWTLTAIATFQSGTAFGVSAPNQTGVPYGGERPNRICNGTDTSLSGNLRSDGLKDFNTSCFVLPQSGYFGNAARTILYGPGVNNWDIGIQKYFTATEKIKLQFRAEMFNAFNHAQFGIPNATLGAATFGIVTTANSPRLTQLGLKLNF